MSSINEMAGARCHVVVFKTKVLHFKIENSPIKDTNGKRKFKRMLSFLFVDKRHCPLSYAVLKLRSGLLIANPIKHVCYNYDWLMVIGLSGVQFRE